LDVIKLLGLFLPLGALLACGLAPLDWELGVAVALAAIAAVTGSVQQSIGGTFLGAERTYLDAASESLAAVVLILGAVLATLFAKDALVYVAVVALSRAVACGLALWLFALFFGGFSRLLEASMRRAFTAGLPYMLNAGSAFVFLRADILMLGALSGANSV